MVSRGGLGKLYHPGAQSIDLYSLRSVESVAAENTRAREEFRLRKPLKVTPWEQSVADELGLPMVHPRPMVEAFRWFWVGACGVHGMTDQTDLTPLVKPPKPEWLPDRYTAVRWYHREGKRDVDAEMFWRLLMTELCDRETVVWVGSPFKHDDHEDGVRCGLSMPPGPPEDNLYRQAAVLAHADRFVGTYGGTAHLALRLGVPTAAFYAGKHPQHRHWNQWIARKTGVPFVSGSIKDVELMRDVL